MDMVADHKFLDIIYTAVEQHNAAAPPDRRLDPSPDTVLFGSDGKLDSLQFVSLVIAIEDTVQEELGIAVSIADEEAFTEEAGAFRTLGSLADHLAHILRDRTDV